MKQQTGQKARLPLPILPAKPEPKTGSHGNTDRLGESVTFNAHDKHPTSGSLRISEFGNDCKDGSHWTSVLNRATTFSSQDIEGDDAQRNAQLPIYQTVLLFACERQASEKELITGLPSRKTCDDLISSYFQLLNNSCFLHAREFLKHYDKFWENPETASASWLGLLYSTMCVAVQFKTSCPPDCACKGISHSCGQEALLRYREKTVQCLIRAQYGRGGPFIMETLLHYFIIENYLRRDSNTGLWLLLGTIVQIALRMGYHRDPQHFKAMSPYEGEMRRRLWTHIYIFDAVLATQLGLPTIIKESFCDTLPPQNISDEDYDSTAKSLPPPRPEAELTQSSVTIAKFWLAKALTKVADALSSLHPYSLVDATRIDDELTNTFKRLPSSTQHRPLSESILDSRITSLTISQRINIKLVYLRGRMLLYWKFVAMSKDLDQYEASRNIVVDSAIESLELQHLTVDELRPCFQITPINLYDSAIVNHTHLLATSVLCFYLRYFRNTAELDKLNKIQTLLRGTQAIWQRSSNHSVEAQRAADALSAVLEWLAETFAQESEQMGHVDRGTRFLGEDRPAMAYLLYLDLFNWPQLPFAYGNDSFNNPPLMPLEEGTAFLYPPCISPMDVWAASLESENV
ncbi:fungal-specific transcription factor domain-containing protein [Stachybotrys elegans]|uniref:Fungal-specific transcription factor domain-containing protein n=1 Tax=Stachybotrys elegans TaxID=80388 RepID=A0A8K0SNU2_9HYPO|nr:fungal-specific transcription factor domain-containing protein [Stachybotrys elegans]